MIALGLALAFAAALAEDQVDVVVLSKLKPHAIYVLSGGCRAKGFRRDVTRIEADAAKEKVKICARRACTSASRAVLACADLPRVRTEELDESRIYGRSLVVSLEQGALRMVTRLALEDYVAGVVRSELGDGEPEAKRALAVVARTYAKNAIHEKRHEDAALCDLTHCQVFRGIPVRRDADPASWTEGQVLLRSDGRISPVFFQSACGGHTRSAESTWPSVLAPDVIGIWDLDDRGVAWCGSSPHFAWVFEIGEKDLARALSALVHRRLDAATLELSPVPGSDSTRFLIRDRDQEDEIVGSSLHLHLGRTFGWAKVKSGDFVATRAGSSFRLEGRGMGHGTGLCLAGANARAKAGQPAEEILSAYFPKLQAGRSAERALEAVPPRVQIDADPGIREDRKRSIAEACESVALAMGDRGAEWRIALHQAHTPDEFAHRTRRPRFEAAATLGEGVWLQPESVLGALDDVPLIERHECVHAWLRRMEVPPLPRPLEEAIALGASGQLAHIPPQRTPRFKELTESERIMTAPQNRLELERALALTGAAIWPLFAHTDSKTLVDYLRTRDEKDWLHRALPGRADQRSIADLFP